LPPTRHGKRDPREWREETPNPERRGSRGSDPALERDSESGGPMVEQPAQDAAVKRRRERSLAWEFRHLIPMVAIAISAIAIWELIFRSGVWGFLFPGPSQVARALVDFWNSTRLVRAIVATLRRLAVGFLISLVLGALLAFLMVRFTTFGKGIQPYILGLQIFPSIAWVPLSLIWFGFSETTLLFVTVGLGFLLNASASVPDIAGVMGVMLVILVIGIVVDQLAFTKTQEWASRRRGLRPRG